MNNLHFQDSKSAERRIELYLRSKPDREIAALLLQEVLPELGDCGHACTIIESAIDRLVRSNGGSLNGLEPDLDAQRLQLEESDASIELFQLTF
ncbi:MAG TPA: hypothetical protein VN918_07695, partial [Myxococcaceae bacterium]|nr:hypothetical protein [Myxococcaceae bacterium]